MKNKKVRIVIGVVAVLFLCCIGSFIIVQLSPKKTQTQMANISTSSPVPPVAPTNKPTVTYTPAPTNTVGPTNTPLPPAATLPPLEALKIIITSVLGSSNRNVPRLNSVDLSEGMLTVSWAINDNLTEGLIRYGAKMDIVKILQTAQNSGISYDSVLAAGYFSMQDVYGNASEAQVIGLVYNKSTIDKINWQNFLTDNIYTIADNGFVNPTFKP